MARKKREAVKHERVWEDPSPIVIEGKELSPITIERIEWKGGATIVYTHAYAYKGLILAIWGNDQFTIMSTGSRKDVGCQATFTKGVDGLIAGFTELATYAPDWDELAQQEERLPDVFTLLIATYDQYMGAYWDYSLFGRKFAEKIARVVSASKAMSNSAL